MAPEEFESVTMARKKVSKKDLSRKLRLFRAFLLVKRSDGDALGPRNLRAEQNVQNKLSNDTDFEPEIEVISSIFTHKTF